MNDGSGNTGTSTSVTPNPNPDPSWGSGFGAWSSLVSPNPPRGAIEAYAAGQDGTVVPVFDDVSTSTYVPPPTSSSEDALPKVARAGDMTAVPPMMPLKIPRPTPLDFELILENRLITAVEAARACHGREDAEEFLRHIGIDLVLRAVVRPPVSRSQLHVQAVEGLSQLCLAAPQVRP